VSLCDGKPGVLKTANKIRRCVGISVNSALLLAVSATLSFPSHSEGCYPLLIRPPHQCIVGCQSGSEKRIDRRTRTIGRPDQRLADQHGYARQTGRHGYKGGKKRIEEGYLFSPVKETATSAREAKKNHAYPGNRQMGRQREVICRA
jgi:hypothetical protein